MSKNGSDNGESTVFFVFPFYVYVNTSLFIFTNSSDNSKTYFTKYVYKNKPEIFAYDEF